MILFNIKSSNKKGKKTKKNKKYNKKEIK